MARMYSRKKGKSGSKRPSVVGGFVGYSKDEIERLVVKLSQDGLSTAQIGLVLRDQYGIPLVRAATGRSVTKILEENKIIQQIPEDLFNLIKKAVSLHAHLEKNKRDFHSKRGLALLESKIRRLVKYYVKTKKLPQDWKYKPESAKLIVQRGF